MIGVQHPYPQDVRYHQRVHYPLFRLVIFMEKPGWIKKGIVIFVELPAESSINSPAGAMATGITECA